MRRHWRIALVFGVVSTNCVSYERGYARFKRGAGDTYPLSLDTLQPGKCSSAGVDVLGLAAEDSTWTSYSSDGEAGEVWGSTIASLALNHRW